ncbi:uncharacterized protein LOC135462437 [Liolophura sinensis]|uniref:uncharacterized protein LOC135462437 n=1 Tax=Liolophura sinensis TaxID=3198878 RepID=UPI003158D143
MSMGRPLQELLVLGLVFAASLAAPVSQHCTSNADCSDPNSSCRPHRCDWKICQCNVHYVINRQTDMCEKASVIGDPCNKTKDCLPRHSICSANHTCECEVNFLSTIDLFWCISTAHVALGDLCNKFNNCGIGAECKSGTCSCKPWHGAWTEDEKWAGLPQSKYIQCQNKNYTLNECNGVTFVPPSG